MATSFMQLSSQLFGGALSREGCFESKGSIADVAVVCHEARGVDLAPGEKLFVSVRDVLRPEGEQAATMGSACQLRALDLDATILVRIWASQDSRSKKPGFEAEGVGGDGRRECGEVQIPLRPLEILSGGMLYQTWVELEVMADSLSFTPGAPLGTESALDAFERGVTSAAFAFHGARVCLSVCKAADLGKDGRLLLAPDCPADARAAHWPALIRSQQQHATMSFAQLSEGAAAQAAGSPNRDRGTPGDSGRLRELRERTQAQAEELASLRAQLARGRGDPYRGNDVGTFDGGSFGSPSPLPSPRSPSSSPARSPTRSPTRSPGCVRRNMAAEVEVEHVRVDNERKRAEIDALRAELETLSTEANSKIDQANERIRELKRDRDEARVESSRLHGQSRQLEDEVGFLKNEIQMLSEQKEALLGIVEDLHNSCVGAGLHSAGRQSIDSTLANLKVH